MSDELTLTPTLNFSTAAIDSLNLALVLFDAALEPIFISSEAAKLLQIRGRRGINDQRDILEPLCQAARKYAAADPAAPVLGGVEKRAVEELTLKTGDSREIPVLAEPRRIEFVHDGAPGSGIAVMLHDMTELEPYFELSTQTRKNRRSIVLLSSLVGGPPDGLTANELEAAFKEKSAASASPVATPGDSADLTQSLTLAVEIADRLVPRTFRISIEVATTVLVRCRPLPLAQMLSHMLLEAADFAGPFGRARVALNLTSGAPSATSAQMLLFVQRMELKASDAFQRFVVHKSMPPSYKVTQSSSGQPLKPDEAAYFEKFLERSSSQPGITSAMQIAEQTYSENLRIAAGLADECSSMLQVKMLAQNYLAMTLTLPLVT